MQPASSHTRRPETGGSSLVWLAAVWQAEAMIVCVGSDELNIYDVGDYMTKKGWSLNSLQVQQQQPDSCPFLSVSP